MNSPLVEDVHKGKRYIFKLNENRTGLSLTDSLADKVADNNSEVMQSQSLFGYDFGGITNIDIGPDGYLYVLSLGRGIIL